jgi:hypothetical protein
MLERAYSYPFAGSELKIRPGLCYSASMTRVQLKLHVDQR